MSGKPEQYYIELDGSTFGPYSVEYLQSLVEQDLLEHDREVISEDGTRQIASKIKGLVFGELPNALDLNNRKLDPIAMRPPAIPQARQRSVPPPKSTPREQWAKSPVASSTCSASPDGNIPNTVNSGVSAIAPASVVSIATTPALSRTGASPSSPLSATEADFSDDEESTEVPFSSSKKYYTRRTVNEEAELNAVRTELNTWANSIPHHPHRNLGSAVELLGVSDFPGYRLLVDAQIEKREKLDTVQNMRSSILHESRVGATKKELYSYSFNKEYDFLYQVREQELSDTLSIIECSACAGRGEVECTACNGYGKLECGECNGKGEVQCSTCFGKGEHVCSRCSPGSRQYCDRCHGKGFYPCDKCRNGFHNCNTCGGRGEVTCSSCRGSGKITCSTCEGKGKLRSVTIIRAEYSPHFQEAKFINSQLPQQVVEHEDTLTTDTRTSILKLQGETFPAAPFRSFGYELLENEYGTLVDGAASRGAVGLIINTRVRLFVSSALRVRYRYGGKLYVLWLYPADGFVFAERSPISEVSEVYLASANTLLSTGHLDEAIGKLSLIDEMGYRTPEVEAVTASLKKRLSFEAMAAGVLGATSLPVFALVLRLNLMIPFLLFFLGGAIIGFFKGPRKGAVLRSATVGVVAAALGSIFIGAITRKFYLSEWLFNLGLVVFVGSVGLLVGYKCVKEFSVLKCTFARRVLVPLCSSMLFLSIPSSLVTYGGCVAQRLLAPGGTGTRTAKPGYSETGTASSETGRKEERIAEQSAAVEARTRRSPSTAAGSDSVSARLDAAVTVAVVDAALAGDPCEQMTGDWKGTFVANIRGEETSHTLTGKITGTRQNCVAIFKVAWWKYAVTEHFAVTFVGDRISMDGTKVEKGRFKGGYLKDRFVGKAEMGFTRFVGRMTDEKPDRTGVIMLDKQ